MPPQSVAIKITGASGAQRDTFAWVYVHLRANTPHAHDGLLEPGDVVQCVCVDQRSIALLLPGRSDKRRCVQIHHLQFAADAK